MVGVLVFILLFSYLSLHYFSARKVKEWGDIVERVKLVLVRPRFSFMCVASSVRVVSFPVFVVI